MSGGRLRENYRNGRTVRVRRAHLGVGVRQLDVSLMSVSGRAFVMVVSVAAIPVDVQHCRFGIEAEERQAKQERDRPHLDKST